MGYRVTGGAVVLPTKDGSERYLYTGAPVDEDAFTEAGIQHAVSVGLITETVAASTQEQVTLPEGDPTEKWTAPQLKKFAADNGIELGEAKKKDEVWSVIAAALAAAATGGED